VDRKEARAWDEISRAVTRLLQDEPFLGHLLAGVPRRVGRDVPTAAVALGTHGVTLLINPDFFVATTTRIPERVAIVKHEVLHLLLRHLTRRGDRDRRLWNLACDLVVNRLVRPWPLPEVAITEETFPDVDLAGDLGVEEVYRRLLAARVEHEMPEGVGDHGGWGEPSQTEAEVFDASLDRLVRQTVQRCKGWGKLPASLTAELEIWLEARAPKLDWRRVLRGFTQGAHQTRIRSTLRRPSRRFGTLPGTRVQRQCRLLVAIDTSASIAEEELTDFFAELRGAWRAGAEITVVECDAGIHHEWRYCGEPPRAVHGRGGTAFEPVFALAAARWPYFDALVYFTDGEGPEPSTAPVCPVLWVLVRGGTAPGVGRAVRIS
jgi:predicted metal-dependent peptidase